MTDTQDNRRGARRLWLWPVAVLVSFPIGGYLADLVVDGVDSLWAALVGGLIAGLIIGAAEWFVLRRWVRGSVHHRGHPRRPGGVSDVEPAV
jgi:hypothetical protein